SLVDVLYGGMSGGGGGSGGLMLLYVDVACNEVGIGKIGNVVGSVVLGGVVVDGVGEE
ncbi:hypothetical protein Tco_1262820, partial [Tanacetum coccineum]